MYSNSKLNQLLQTQGRTVNWLAAMTGYDPSTISRILNGRQPMSEKFASAVAPILGVPVEWLRTSDRDPVGTRS